MTHKQTGEAIKQGYGLGFATQGDSFGHGGAYATSMNIDAKRGLRPHASRQVIDWNRAPPATRAISSGVGVSAPRIGR